MKNQEPKQRGYRVKFNHEGRAYKVDFKSFPNQTEIQSALTIFQTVYGISLDDAVKISQRGETVVVGALDEN